MKKTKANLFKNKWPASFVCLTAVLLLVGIIPLVLLGCQKTPTGTDVPAQPEFKLYWNVERDHYKTGKYNHQAVGEDLYRLLFAVDGEQVKLDVQGYYLVQKIDTLEVMGLEFDENGVVVGVKNVEECTGGYAAKRYYVESVDGNTVVANNNSVFSGYSKTLVLNEETGIYDVSDTGPLCGIPTQVRFNDEIIAIEDEQGNISHVFTIPYKEPGDVYWNVDKPYDSVNKISARQPNELMQYEMDFILNGELVTYFCRDLEVVNKIDGSRVCGLIFDENGYIVDYQTVKLATNGGRLGATNYYVSELDYERGVFRFRKKAAVDPADSPVSLHIGDNMIVYDMTGNEAPKGTQTELKVNDRVICVVDSRTMIKTVFVVGRGVDSELYWNVDRDWNKTTLTTNRRPDKNGWYYFKMAVNGQQITVKTNDLAIANAIEQPVNVGLKLNGDIVEKVFPAANVYPAGTFASWYKVTAIAEDGTITCEKTSDGVTTQRVGKPAENCKFFNTSVTASMEGEVITQAAIKIGDTIHAYKNYSGDIVCLFVVGSVPDSPMYWNVDKTQYWDSKNKVSTRTPDANGYYNILFAVNGKQVTLRTRDKKMVDDIDGRTCMGLNVSGTTITKVFGAAQTQNTKGGLFASSWYVTAIKGNRITAASSDGKSESKSMSWNCQVFDVSKTAKMVGEKASVQVGDQIRGLLNENEQISVLYILNTANHQNNHACDHCGKNVMWKPWDGSSTMADGGHYVLSCDAEITKAVGIKEGVEVTLCLNGHTLSRSSSRVLGDIKGTLNIFDCVGTGHVHGGVNNNASVAMISGGTLNIYGGTFSAEEVTEAGKNGGIFTIIGGGAINMYGGTVTGGKTTGYGGNINISDGTFTLHDGQILNGTSGEGQFGGNIAMSGDKAVLVVKGGKIFGGVSGSYGGNIAIAKKEAQLNIYGGVIENGTAATHGGNISVALGNASITGAQITGGTAANYGGSMSVVNSSVATIIDSTITGGQIMARNLGGLTLGGKLVIDQLHLHNITFSISEEKPLTDAQIALSMSSPGVFCENIRTDLSGCFTSVDETFAVYYENNSMLLDAKIRHLHCDCGGVDQHTCDDNIRWTVLTEDTVMVDGGHYYLAADLSFRVSYEENATVYLCLNGHKLTHVARVFADIAEGQTVNIYDCGTTGSIHGTTSVNNASVLMVKGTLNIYGGTFTAEAIPAENKNGGIMMAMGSGVINFYNGVISGGNTTGHGGCVYITQQASFHMYGGQIKDGASMKNGGTVAITGDAVFIITGGVISGGHAEGNGNCVYFDSTVPMVLGGDAKIEDIFLANAVAMKLSEQMPLDTDNTDETVASVGFTKEAEGILVDGISQEQANCFVNNGKGKAVWQADQLLFKLPHAHCWCQGAIKAPEHTCDAAVEWTAINSDAANPVVLTDGGHYFLNWKGQNVAKGLKVAENATVYLCLNGSTIRAQSVLTLGVNAKIVICDCSEDQSGAMESTKNTPIQVASGQEVTLMSGSISGTNHYNGQNIPYAVTVNLTGGNFYMYGGKIVDGHNASGHGGNLIVDGGSTFYMYEGLISGGSASGTNKHGGNIYVRNGTFQMEGGTITGGKATGKGGNVMIMAMGTNGQSVFIMNGGTISGGLTDGVNAANGGNICVNNSSGKLSRFEMNGGTVTGGKALQDGGNIYINGAKDTVLLTGGLITDGEIYNKGGNLEDDRPEE